MRVKINLDTTNDAIGLSRIAEKLEGNITITDGNGLKVNAKSVMGALYSLEFSELWLESDHDIYHHIVNFIKVED